MQNNQVFLSPSYHTQFYTPNKNYPLAAQNNTPNMNMLSNEKSINSQSPSIHLKFEVPKQNANIHFVSRTPPPSHNRRDFVNLYDNPKIKELSNSPVQFQRLNVMDSINNSPQIKYHPIRNLAPQHYNLKVLRNSNNNGLISYHNSPIYINIDQQANRMARTPPPKKNISNNNINSINYNNISNYNNDSSLYSYQNISTNLGNQIPTMNNNNYLKQNNNMKIIKVSDFNQNKNYESIANIKLNNNNSYKNFFINNYNNSLINNYKNTLINNYNNFNHNYINKINIKKNPDINRNNKFQNYINIKKTYNYYPTDNYRNNLKDRNISNINQYYDYQNQSQNDIYKNNENKIKSINQINYNLSTGNNTSFTDNSFQNKTPNIQQNHITIIPIPQNKYKYIFHYGENGVIKRSFREITITKPVPGDDFNVAEFQKIKQIGEGTYGRIYCVKWIKNNELYALKKLNFYGKDLFTFRKKVKIMQNFMTKTQHNGLIKIYGDKCLPSQRPNEFDYYIIMELGEKDWEKEMIMREKCSYYYSEYELLQIILQLVKTLSLMQKNNITHRDIKPQNIIICKNAFKLCDFDDVKIIIGNGPIIQSVRGSELYMSPILFYAYNSQVPNVLHNTYKSDVFSLGMTIFLAAALSAKPLCDIRELKDMNFISQIINNTLKNRYSQNLITLIIKMLQIDENLRFDFIELEKYISSIWPN